MNIFYEKSRARIQAKRRRSTVSAPAQAAIEIIRHFPAVAFRGHIIGGILPLPEEIDTRPLMTCLHDTGFKLALPCTPRKGYPLTFKVWSPDAPLRKGRFQTWEPLPDAEDIHPDVILMPLLAFTDSGLRLGYGGGYYDRTLDNLRRVAPVFACGVAFDAQKASTLPTEPTDMRLDAILTETGFRKIIS